MPKTLKMPESPSLLIPAVDEVPRISDAERADLRVSLEKASADIASGDFDVVTRQSLRSEFDAIYSGGKSDTDIDAGMARHGTHHS
jgi:hypothetical protein